MKIYKLNRSYAHIVDKDHDIHLVPFEDSDSLEYDLLNAELLKIPKPIYFIGYFQVLDSETDFPTNNGSLTVLSNKMLATILSSGIFAHTIYPVKIIDSTFLGEKFMEDGSVKPEVPIKENYQLLQLKDKIPILDYDRSEYVPMSDWQRFPSRFSKFIAKEPKTGFPAMFRGVEKPSSIFINQQTKEVLESNGIKGCVFEEVAVTPYKEHQGLPFKATQKKKKQISDFKHRKLDKEELQEINFEYQGGIEFIYWYHDMGNIFDNKKLLTGMMVVSTKLKEGLEFPIAEYNSAKDVTTLMGFTLGEMLKLSFNWKWYYFDELKKDIWGYTIVSPDEKFGICVRDIFYRAVIYEEEILFKNLSDLLIKGQYPTFDKDSFEIYNPWYRDYSEIYKSKIK